jgi:hypothetical protein
MATPRDIVADLNLILSTPRDIAAGFEFDRGYSMRHRSWIWVQQPGPAYKGCNSNTPIHFFLHMHADLAPRNLVYKHPVRQEKEEEAATDESVFL